MKVSIFGGPDERAEALKRLLEQYGAEVLREQVEDGVCDVLVCLDRERQPRAKCDILLVLGEARPAECVTARCAVSCGFSDRDTMTLSGIRNGHAALSLQRELVDIYGVVTEQGEFIVDSTPRDPQLLLAAAASLLALGAGAETLGSWIRKLEC